MFREWWCLSNRSQPRWPMKMKTVEKVKLRVITVRLAIEEAAG